jgi:hypothetical protein
MALEEQGSSKFIISGGEVLELNNQLFAPPPPDTHVSAFMPKWQRDYRLSLQAQENNQMTETIDDATTVVAPVVPTTPTIEEIGAVIDTVTIEVEVNKSLYAMHDYELIKHDIQLKKQELIDALITAEIKQAMSDIDVEFVGQFESIDSRIDVCREHVKRDVLRLGHSVQNPWYQAQWKKGAKGGYNADILDGLALIIPQIAKAKKPDGAPQCSIVPKK